MESAAQPGLLACPPDRCLPEAQRAQLLAQLAQYLGPGRTAHSQGVAATAVDLAQRHAPELTRGAELAGLLHDHAKKLSGPELTRLAQQYDIDLTPGELETPALLHGKVGAALLAERFGLDDDEVAQAVADHVTGRAGMGPLSQVLFVADQIEPGRDFPGVDDLRRLAQQDLRAAVGQVARKKIEYVLMKGQWLEPSTVEVWNAFRQAPDKRAK